VLYALSANLLLYTFYLISTFDIANPEKIAAIAKPKIKNIGTIAVIKIKIPAKEAMMVKILTSSPFKASVTTLDAVTVAFCPISYRC